MKLQIIRIADRGVPNKERVHLSVLQDTNLSFYVVLLTRYVGAGGVANGNLAAYWFPTQQVRAGDQVILSSGKGVNSNSTDARGCTTFFYYWGVNTTVWGHPDNCVVVLEGGGWGASARGG